MYEAETECKRIPGGQVARTSTRQDMAAVSALLSLVILVLFILAVVAHKAWRLAHRPEIHCVGVDSANATPRAYGARTVQSKDDAQ